MTDKVFNGTLNQSTYLLHIYICPVESLKRPNIIELMSFVSNDDIDVDKLLFSCQTNWAFVCKKWQSCLTIFETVCKLPWFWSLKARSPSVIIFLLVSSNLVWYLFVFTTLFQNVSSISTISPIEVLLVENHWTSAIRVHLLIGSCCGLYICNLFIIVISVFIYLFSLIYKVHLMQTKSI